MKRSAFIGLVAAAALALTASVGAATASASQPGFNGSHYPLFVKTTGGTPMKWTFGATTFKCNTALGKASLSSSSAELVQSMNFAGCVLGGLSAQINMNGCTFNDSVSTFDGGKGTGGREIACGAGNQVTITRGACVLQIPSQALPGSLSYVNGKSEGVDVVNATYALSGLKYTGGAGCAAEHIGPRENGGITGSWTLKAFVDNGGSEGAQINLWIQ